MQTEINPQVAETLKKSPAIETADRKAFEALLKSHKISSDEYARIEKVVGRTPTMSELGAFSAMWSEHCSYKSSRVHLRRFPTTGPNVVVGPGENAGVVRLEGKLCLAFKMESHNHPSYIEPYQGASTGVGGILRDVFCMGARPIANLNCLRFGERSHPRTEYIAKRSVKGIGDYGNCIGVPTIGGSVSYDATYNGNCLVNAMTVGLIRDDKIFKGFATGHGNLVVYVGSATGRDGIHGATMASDSFASTDQGSKTTVQVGDPFAEKLLLEATLEVLEKDLVVGIQDMGAAGITSSSFEMAGRAGNGVYIELDRVPLRAKKMTAYEIMLSESQERMLMVIEPKKWEALSEVLKKWGLAHSIIGVVTGTGKMQASYQGYLEIDAPIAPLTDEAPVYERPMAARKENPEKSSFLEGFAAKLKDPVYLKKILLEMLADTGSVEPIYNQYDHHIGTRTVFGPDSGGAGVLWIRDPETTQKPWLGVSIAAGCNERRVANHPYRGGADAVLSCVRAIAASGGEALAVTDCLNFGAADNPEVMREFSDAVDGISRACKELSIPVVSGNVSLYNSTDGVSIYPTPMIGVVGKVEDVREATPAFATGSGDLYLLCAPGMRQNFAASLAAKIAKISPRESCIPDFNWDQERKAMSVLAKLRKIGAVKAAKNVGAGGIALAAIKMLVGRNVIEGKRAEFLGCGVDFVAEGGPVYILEITNDFVKKATELVVSLGFELKQLTKMSAGSGMSISGASLSPEELRAAWTSSHRM